MMGIELEFNCKKCNKGQAHEVTGTGVYHINHIKDITYIPLNCERCNILHFVAENAEHVDSTSEEDMEIAYVEKVNELTGYFGSYESARKYVKESMIFLPIEERVIVVDDVKFKEYLGVAMY